MQIQENISLKPFNTFGIEATAAQFVEVSTKQELIEVLTKNKGPLLILGGGSNVLLTTDFNGLVIKNNFTGIEVIHEDDSFVELKVGAGENWHQFVLYCIENNYCGIENLSLIPGNVGASPMQNIGAYGVEVKDLITEVETIDLINHTERIFENAECDFGYRTSVFKTTEKGKYFITAVNYRLSKRPNLNTSYGAIENELNNRGIKSPTIKDISDAVISIRQSKLPDPAQIGNSGSFFKNPVVSASMKEKVLTNYSDAPCYDQGNGSFKLAAGWLIEQCGWKGKRVGDCGVHDKQALVLVNHGRAKGADIYALSEEIIASVRDKFGITLEREVNII